VLSNCPYWVVLLAMSQSRMPLTSIVPMWTLAVLPVDGEVLTSEIVALLPLLP